MMTFMSKKKKFKFKVLLELVELSSVPFVTGILFAKVRLHDGGNYVNFSDRVSHWSSMKDRSLLQYITLERRSILINRSDIRSNNVIWNSRFDFLCKITASANTGVLDSCVCRISVRKELRGGRSHQKLGFVDLNLAQFAGSGQQCRRFLLEGYGVKHRQDNSTVKVMLEVSLIAGDPVFKVPSVLSTVQPSCSAVSMLPSETGIEKGSDEHSKGSTTSISSGFSSLNRKGLLDGQAPEAAAVLDREDTLGHHVQFLNTGAPGAGGSQLEPGHSRNASCVSHQSHGSDYSSLSHSRHSSLSVEAGTGHNRASSISSTMERRRKFEELGKGCVGSTRVNAELLVQELIDNSDLGMKGWDNDPGLRMVIQSDGTTALL